MLDYAPEALMFFQHQAPCKPQHQPYPHVKPNYGAKAQYTEDMDTLVLLPKEDKQSIQEVIGTFLYYAHCVNSTMLAALGSTATQQVNPIKNMMKKVQHFLDYASTPPDAIVTYHASDMVLAGQSDASYLSKSKARSWAGRNLFMSNNPAKPPNNGTILTIAQIIKAVMSLAAGLRWGLSTSSAEKPSPPTIPLNSWAIPNLQPQCRWTTPLHLELLTTMSSRN
jgi:hypothetical protein